MPIFRSILAFTLAFLSLGNTAAQAEDIHPKSGWKDAPNPFASEDAVVGGTLTVLGGQNPNSFNYYLDNNTSNSDRFSMIFDSLLGNHPVTLEHSPLLAEKWSISDNKKTFTFWLDKSAKWSDGKPLTAHDVKWTVDILTAKETLSGAMKLYLGKFESPEVINDHQIQFTSSEVHWRNLDIIGGLSILPKHYFEDKDFNKVVFDFPVVSGRYKLGEFKKNQYSTIIRRDDWWAGDFKRHENLYNFETIKFRYMESGDSAFEAFKGGSLDIFRVGQARRWIKETVGDSYDKNWIVKQKIFNHYPSIFQGWVMNTRRAPFDDVRVREAMQLMINRAEMNKSMMFSQYEMTRAYFRGAYDGNNPVPHQQLSFDKDGARKLLSQAGWVANPKTGLLQKDGKILTFTFLSRSPTSLKFLEVFQQDLKDVGVKMEILKKDWSTWVKEMNTFNFDMTWAMWAPGVKLDPESLWHSSEAGRPSSNNFPGYKNAKVDALIEKQRDIFSVSDRFKIVREIDAQLVKSFTYGLLWYGDYTRVIYWNKFGTPDTVFSKYGDDSSSAYAYWWLDEDAEADLADARESGDALPQRPSVVRFDKIFAP